LGEEKLSLKPAKEMGKEMKKLSLTLASIILVAGLALAAPCGAHSDNSATQGTETTIVGYIGDGMCGLKHMDGMGDDKTCTLACVKGGSKFILADRDGKLVYNLDKAGQQKAGEFAGQKVKVTGQLKGKNIRVTSIEAAS
jgi:hypothetical protein